VTEQSVTTADGVRIVYDDVGPRDGTPVVLCHGLAAAAEQFEADAAFFARAGFRVLVPDLRGHGRSATPQPLVPAALSIERFAADLTQTLDHAGVGKVHWVGNSLGGIAALAMLRQDRFLTLATFGTSYAIGLPQVGGHHLITAGRAMLGQRLFATLTANSTSPNPAARAVLKRVLSKTRYEVTAMLAGVLSRYDLIAEGTRATLPILMLRGGRDVAVNSGLGTTIAAMRSRPNFTLVELPLGGHCANLDVPEAFRAALLTFWARHA
jgi:pimeloyl-ACP methyl ester carboxylesterase